VLVDAARRGTTAVFAIHGVQIEPIFQACADLDVDLVDVRHEGAGSRPRRSRGSRVHWASRRCARARADQRADLDDERAARSQRRSLRGRLDAESTLETNGLQVGIDHVALAAPISKWACKVHSIDQLERSWRKPSASRPQRGPVLLDIPADVLDAGATLGRASVGDSWGGAERGGGRCVSRKARRSLSARGAARRLARRRLEPREELLDVTGVPCFADYGAIGTVSDDDERYGGTLYQLGRLAAGNRPDVALRWRAVRVRHAGLRDGGVAGNDHAARRQRSGGGRSLRQPGSRSSPIPAR
jgi:hypothetical protein